MGRTTLVLVDLQRDFFDTRNSPIANIAKATCIPSVRRLVALARERRWKVVHAITEHTGNESLPAPLRRRGETAYCVRGTDGALVVPGLVDEATDLIVSKTHYSALSTALALKAIEGSDCLVLGGVAVDCCLLSSAFDASRLEIVTVVPYQAVGASEEASFVEGLQIIAKSLGRVVSMDDLLNAHDAAGVASISDVRDAAGQWFAEQNRRLCARKGDYEEALESKGFESALRILENAIPL